MSHPITRSQNKGDLERAKLSSSCKNSLRTTASSQLTSLNRVHLQCEADRIGETRGCSNCVTVSVHDPLSVSALRPLQQPLIPAPVLAEPVMSKELAVQSACMSGTKRSTSCTFCAARLGSAGIPIRSSTKSGDESIRLILILLRRYRNTPFSVSPPNT